MVRSTEQAQDDEVWPGTLTASLDGYRAVAGGFLRSRPVHNTIQLVALDAPGDLAEALASHGGLTLWEADGAPVSLAGCSRPAEGVVRLGPVYTPPEHRRRGYGGAGAAAVSRAAAGAGAAHVALFTDLANRTSSALYHRLGYRPVEDRLVLTFGPQGPLRKSLGFPRPKRLWHPLKLVVVPKSRCGASRCSLTRYGGTKGAKTGSGESAGMARSEAPANPKGGNHDLLAVRQ